MNNERITLRQIRAHSGQIDYVRVYDAFTLQIRPWTPAQAEEIKPILNSIFARIKEMDRKADMFDAVVKILSESPELFAQVLHLVYVTIEQHNPTIKVEIDGEECESPIFAEEDMIAELEIPYIWEIIAIIWRQNVEKNLLRGQDEKNKPATNQQIAQAAKATVEQLTTEQN